MLKCELKKFFSKKSNKAILIALLLGTVIISFLAASSMSYTDTGGKLATGFSKITAGRKIEADKNQWKGELTPEKIADAAKNYHELKQSNLESEKTESLLDILYFAAKIYQTETDAILLADLDRLAETDHEHIYDTYADNLQDIAREYAGTPEQEKFLIKQFKKIKLPITYEAYDSWEIMAADAEMYIMILVVVIGFLAAGIIDDEFRTHADKIFFATKYGRSRAIRNKIIVGMLTSTIVYWAIIGILSVISFGLMGVSGFNTSCQIDDPYIMYTMTKGHRYLLVVVCGYIASLLSATVTMLVTAKMHTEKVAVFIPMFMYWVLFIVARLIVTDASYFAPHILVNMDNATKYYVFFQIGKVVFRLIPFVMVLYVVVSIILLPFIYRSCSRYDSAKNLYRESRKWSGFRKKVARKG